MRIQISPTRIIKDCVTVWHEHGPEVDIVMDPKSLTFAENSLEAIFSFHVLEHLFLNEVPGAIANWKKCLQNKGLLFIIVDDFEYIARSLVGGDINIEEYNKQFSNPTQITRESLVQYVINAGFLENNTRVWFADIPNLFKREIYELIISADKI